MDQEALAVEVVVELVVLEEPVGAVELRSKVAVEPVDQEALSVEVAVEPVVLEEPAAVELSSEVAVA